MNEQTTPPSAAATKYKTLGRALAANDVEACREILEIYKNQGNSLTPDDIFKLGVKWFSNKESRPMEIAEFLKEIGFDFEQVTRSKDVNIGVRLPFRLLNEGGDQDLLIQLINRNWIDRDLMDGNGDGFLVNALQASQFDFADKLLGLGVDINASNVAGQTPLHVFASRLNYQAIDWLCSHGADPTVEDLQGARPSEMVPENMNGWDTDCVYELLEDYVVSFNSGGSFVSSPEFAAMVEKERGSENSDEDGQTYGEQADEAKSILTKMGLP
jgi:hypothetical protein